MVGEGTAHRPPAVCPAPAGCVRPGALRAPAASAASAPRELSRGPAASSAVTWEHREGQRGTGDGASVEGAHPKAGWGCCLQRQASGVCGEGAHRALPTSMTRGLPRDRGDPEGAHSHRRCTIQTPPWRGLYSLAVPLTGVSEAAATSPGHILETHSGAHPRTSGSSDSLGGKLSASTKAPSIPGLWEPVSPRTRHRSLLTRDRLVVCFIW